MGSCTGPKDSKQNMGARVSIARCVRLTVCLLFGLSAYAQNQAAPKQLQSSALERKLREARYDLHVENGQ